MESCEVGEIDADTSFKIDKQILTDEFGDPEFLTFVYYNDIFIMLVLYYQYFYTL